jgi:hypothetical protein
MSNKRDWTEDLPGLLEDYAEQAPDGLWEAVRAAAEPRRRRTAAWWYAGGALAAAAAISAVVLLTRPASPIAPIPASVPEMLAEQTVSAEEETLPAAEETNAGEPISEISAPTTEASHPFVPSPSQSQSAPAASSQTVSSPAQETEAPVPVSHPAAASTPEPAREPGQDAAQPGHPSTDAGNPPSQTRVPLHKDPRRTPPAKISPRVQIGVSTGLLAQASSQAPATTPALLSQASSSFLAEFAYAPASRSMSGGSDVWTLLMAGRNKQGATQASHRQSARFGVGLKVGLLPRWGLETGLVRTQLQSSFRTPAGNASLTTERAYTYWGVPLYLHFDALQWRSLDLYLAGGPMLEWSRSCKESQALHLNGKQLASKSGTPAFNDRRMSLNLDAGLQWTFFDHNALFVQPGFSWHIPSEGMPDNFYSAHPAAFQLTLGYRLLLF